MPLPLDPKPPPFDQPCAPASARASPPAKPKERTIFSSILAPTLDSSMPFLFGCSTGVAGAGRSFVFTRFDSCTGWLGWLNASLLAAARSTYCGAGDGVEVPEVAAACLMSEAVLRTLASVTVVGLARFV